MNIDTNRFPQRTEQTWGNRGGGWHRRPSDREIRYFVQDELRNMRGVREARWDGNQIYVKVRNSDARRAVEDRIYDYFGRNAPPFTVKVKPDWGDVIGDVIDIFQNR